MTRQQNGATPQTDADFEREVREAWAALGVSPELPRRRLLSLDQQTTDNDTLLNLVKGPKIKSARSLNAA